HNTFNCLIVLLLLGILTPKSKLTYPYLSFVGVTWGSKGRKYFKPDVPDGRCIRINYKFETGSSLLAILSGQFITRTQARGTNYFEFTHQGPTLIASIRIRGVTSPYLKFF